MGIWFLFALFSAFFWATTDVISRIFSDKISNLAAALALSLGMVFITAAVFFVSPARTALSHTSGQQIFWWMILAGMINGLGYVFFFRFLQTGGNFTQGVPLLFASVVFLTALYGIIFFKDPLTPRIGLGLFLALGAIFLLAK